MAGTIEDANGCDVSRGAMPIGLAPLSAACTSRDDAGICGERGAAMLDDAGAGCPASSGRAFAAAPPIGAPTSTAAALAVARKEGTANDAGGAANAAGAAEATPNVSAPNGGR
jgi:hypothetical protein